MKRFMALTVAAFAMASGSAFALESSVSMTSKLTPANLWKKVGGFCGIAGWHPVVEKCDLSADGKQRTLALKGGGTIVEGLEALSDSKMSYTYTIHSGPLPVANYHSTISVTPDADGSKIVWVGEYDAKGASDADAKKAIDGIYEAGEKALVAN